MTGRAEHGGGEEALRREINETAHEETTRANKRFHRWNRFVRNLRDLTEGDNE